MSAALTEPGPLLPCQSCGEVHALRGSTTIPSCSGHKHGGKPCGQPRLPGQRVCRRHGGSTQRSKEAAARRLQDRQALLAVETFGLPVETDPHTALLEELYRTVGAVHWLGAVVADLERADVVWGRSEETEKGSGEFPGTDRTSAAKPNAWVMLWHTERKHLVEVSKACISAGIEERRVRLAESQGALLAGVVENILRAMYAALVEALGPHGAALVVVERLWPVLMGRIVPEALRQVIEGGEGA